MDLSKIKFIVSEIDGVVTEHLTGIGEMGITLFKQYNMKDFEAINCIKRNYGFSFISSDANISMSLCKKKNIPFFFAERKKIEILNKIIRKFNLTADNILYIGSSYSDVDCIRSAGFSMCPEDSVRTVINNSDHVIPVYSGNGVLSYVNELLSCYINTKRGGD